MSAERKYKRSWRNLLLDTRYQLRFTMFMVGLCAGLMALLGWWVMDVAQSATTVGVNNALGVRCQRPDLTPLRSTPTVELDAPMRPEGEPATPPATPPETPPPAGAAEGSGAAAPAGGAPAEPDADARKRPVVHIDESEMEMHEPPKPPVDTAAALEGIVRYHKCRIAQVAHIESLKGGQRNILWVLFAAGFLLCLGLFVYGIKTTHHVAGPLHKVSLYLAKMKAGRFDKVYDLRKGDQLLDFYEAFKAAHGGMRRMQEADIELLRGLVADAEEGGVAARSPELAAALDELREILARKEESLG